MPEPHDVRSAIENAERSATAGDYFAAERFLREAVSLQEGNLGPFHPDLVNTLNNLAVVYETLDRPDDAERCYRRAYAIAVNSLEPDHPHLTTSEKNYRDFCSARGIPFEPPKPLPPPEPASPPIAAAPEEPPAEVHAVPTPAPPPPPVPVPQKSTAEMEIPGFSATAQRGPGRLAVLGGLGAVALVAIALWWGSGSEETSVAPKAVTPETGASRAAPSERKPAVETPASHEPGRAVEPARQPDPEPRPAKVEPGKTQDSPARSRGTSTASRGPSLEDANLCSSLSRSDWRCSRVSKQASAGQLFFYTRVKSAAPMTIEHRWFWNDKLYRAVTLRIQPNERSGFRTYSRTAVSKGDWRVEARTRDGAVLHEETFVVK